MVEIFTVDLMATTYCQIDGEDCVNFCGPLRKNELYNTPCRTHFYISGDLTIFFPINYFDFDNCLFHYSLTLNVCLDCKHAVESMTQQTRQQIQPQNQPQIQPQQIQPQHNQNPLPDFEPATFQQRRRFSHQDYMRRRSIVTKSLILD